MALLVLFVLENPQRCEVVLDLLECGERTLLRCYEASNGDAYRQVSTSAELRLRQMTTHELENLADCVLQIQSLEQLLM